MPRTWPRLLLLGAIFALPAFAPTCCAGAPAHAGEAFAASAGTQALAAPAITAGLICSVQHAVRWREATWTTAECQARARDFADSGHRWGFAPAQLLAMCIAESDMRVRAQRVDGNALDEGLMGVRCVLGQNIPSTSTDGEPRKSAQNIPKNIPASVRCTNFPVRGLTTKQLLEPRRNIEAGARILAELHHGSLSGYNGDKTGGDRYPKKIGAILAALSGVEVRVRGVRLRTLVRRIVAAVQKERRS